MQNGVFARMAILKEALEKKGILLKEPRKKNQVKSLWRYQKVEEFLVKELNKKRKSK
jgi:hypothetical protein